MNPTFISFFFLILSLPACSVREGERQKKALGYWSDSGLLAGKPRSGAIAFSIGGKAFSGLGYDGDEYVSDFYVFDIERGHWERKNNFPGILRERAVAFSIDGKGYIGLGYNRHNQQEALADFWEYDPATDHWKRVADFGGTARYNAVGFVIGTKAYVGTGYDGSRCTRDFWQFDPQANTWGEIESYPGEKIERGLSFVVKDKAYVGCGTNNGWLNTDLWEFDPQELNWTKRSPANNASYSSVFRQAVRRYDAVAFTIGDRAYVLGGISSQGKTDKTVYEFNSNTLEWSQRTSFGGAARSMAIAFVLDGRAFAGGGQNSTMADDDVMEFMAYVLDDKAFSGTGKTGTCFFNDIWEFKTVDN
jgi:N-acetylneuraminic acid mutarotase